MADKNIVVPTPTATTPGVMISISRSATGISVDVTYHAAGDMSLARVTEAEYAQLPAPFRADVELLFTRVVPHPTVQSRMGF